MYKGHKAEVVRKVFKKLGFHKSPYFSRTIDEDDLGFHENQPREKILNIIFNFDFFFS